MSRDGRIRTSNRTGVQRRLSAVRNYLRSIHAACLYGAAPAPGHVILVEGDDRRLGIPAGGYTLVARVDDRALLCPIDLSPRGELEFTDRLVTACYGNLTPDMVVGRDTMIIPE